MFDSLPTRPFDYIFLSIAWFPFLVRQPFSQAFAFFYRFESWHYCLLIEEFYHKCSCIWWWWVILCAVIVAWPSHMSFNLLGSPFNLSFSYTKSLQNVFIYFDSRREYRTTEEYHHLMNKILKVICNIKVLKVFAAFLLVCLSHFSLQ